MAEKDKKQNEIQSPKKLNVSDFIRNKTVKLSDAYRVTITQNIGKEEKITDKDPELFNSFYEEIPSCISVRIPMYKPNTTEVIKYKNKTIKLKMPNYEDVQPLSLTFWETAEGSIKKLIKNLMYINGMTEEDVEPVFNKTTNPFRYVDELTIEVLDNSLQRTVCSYIFEKVKLVNYSYDYQLDYTSYSLPLVTLEFSYEKFKLEGY